jgi:hypothetical protein
VRTSEGNDSQIIEIDRAGQVVWSFSQGLLFAHNADPLSDNHMLISDTGNDRVIEIDTQGKIVWSSDEVSLSDGSALRYPNDANGLPENHLLITDRENHRVIEIDRAGTIVWQFGETGILGGDGYHLNGPHNADRLENGNTLVADSNNNRILEVAPDGSIVWEYRPTGTDILNWPRDADRLDNGNTLITDSRNNRIIEVTPDGKVVWSYTRTRLPYDADRLPNGNTLVADSLNHRVIEVQSQSVSGATANKPQNQAHNEVVTFIDSLGIGEIAILLKLPDQPRYPEGAPVVVNVSGFFIGQAGFDIELDADRIGVIYVSYLWPGLKDRRTNAQSGGVYDYGGPDCLAALRDVIRFASGEIANVDGLTIDELIDITPLTGNVGLYAFSHSGIVATNVLALHGQGLPHVKYFIGRENPTIDAMYPLEPGYYTDDRTPVFNPYYHPEDYTPTKIHIDYSTVGWLQNEEYPDGRPYFAVPDGPDYILSYKHPRLWGKDYWSAALIQALLDNGALTRETWPRNLATPEEAAANWPFRTTVHNYPLLADVLPDLKVMLVFASIDHVQVAVDKPHIHQAYDGFHHTAGLWCRLNPDPVYVESLAEPGNAFPDNAANTEPSDWMNARAWGYRVPQGSRLNTLAALAAVAEMVDRVRADNWEPNLSRVLFEY